jgi:hypothetical protein
MSFMKGRVMSSGGRVSLAFLVAMLVVMVGFSVGEGGFGALARGSLWCCRLGLAGQALLLVGRG